MHDSCCLSHATWVTLTCWNWNGSKRICLWQNYSKHSMISNHKYSKHFWYLNHLWIFIQPLSFEILWPKISNFWFYKWAKSFSKIKLPVSVNKNIRANRFMLTGRIDRRVKTIFYILEAKVWLKIDFLSNQK